MLKRDKAPNRRGSKALFDSAAGLTNHLIVAEPLEPRMLLTNTFTVSNLNDSGNGSLRAAILSADGDGGSAVINFAGGLTGTINLTSELPDIDTGMTINGPGAALLTVNGHGHGSVFNISRIVAKIDNLTITGGNSAIGGGIFNRGRLNIANSVISGNSASGAGSGAGIFSNFYLGVTNSIISGNSAYYGGGGVYNESGVVVVTNSTIAGNTAQFGGGIFNNIGSMTVTASTISGNSAASGGGIYNADATLTVSNSNIISNSTAPGIGNSGGGILSKGGTLTLMNSTVSGNSTSGEGGGILGIYDVARSISDSVTVIDSTVNGNSANYGGGIFNSKSSLTVANSTITGNSVGTGSFDSGGGIEGGYHSTNTIVDSTITGNFAPHGGGIFFDYATGILDGVLIAANTGGGDIVVENSVSFSGSNDLIGDGSDGGVLAGSLRGSVAKPLNPLLSSLANFGGPTQTLALMPGSPAVGAGANFPVLDSNNNDITATDQRGMPRPSGSGIDIGAYQSGLLVNTLTDPTTATFGILSLREAIGLADSSSFSQTITFASGLSGTISLASQLPALIANLTIDGPGASLLAINGDGQGSVLTVTSGRQVLIENLTITGGSATSGSNADGGGILNNGGTLTILGCTITGNTAGSGGGIESSGPLTITNSTISGNVVAGLGGGIYNLSLLNLTGSTISGNSAAYGGGVENDFNQLTVTNSTFTGNVASGDGGAIFSEGPIAITDSTVSGNTASKFPGGGGIYSNAGSGTVQLLDGTIVAGNADGDIRGGSSFGGVNNLIGDGSDSTSFISSLSGTAAAPLNPLLSPLGNFGGPTLTMALLPGSPATGHGTNFSVPSDQRGFPRPPTSGIDIGADQGALFAGDTNFDGAVNLTDLLTLLNNYGQTGKGWMQGDFNFDGTVNLTDLLALLNNYGQSAADTSTDADILSYKTRSSPFASEPLSLNSSGNPLPNLNDADSDILQKDDSRTITGLLAN